METTTEKQLQALTDLWDRICEAVDDSPPNWPAVVAAFRVLENSIRESQNDPKE